MCDACVYGTKALDCMQHMLAVNGSPTSLSDYSNFTSPITALLGERYSELSIPVAKLLSLYMIPQVKILKLALMFVQIVYIYSKLCNHLNSIFQAWFIQF